MHFFSDNATPVCPEVMAAIAAADRADHGYDGDAWSARLDDAFSTLFETEVQALWVASGTAANSIALACLCPPYGGVIAHEEAHIVVDECGAPGFFTHGATLMPLPGVGAKLTPDSVRDRLKTIRPDVHQVPARAISITNATEYGLVYAPEEVAALGDVAKAHDLGLHMDGARFANAVAHLGCAPADLTWRAGVNALSFGCVKNGGMIGEALLFFGAQAQDRAAEARRWRKRSGHLFSKGRYLATQLLAMIEDGLWLRNASAANAAAQALAKGAGNRLMHPVEANELFVRLTAEEAANLRAQDFDFHNWGEGAARLVTNWSQDVAAVAPLAAALAQL
ncbi:MULTISPECIES: threonine aldolase family protein [Sphingobium]|jgi:threonine aldolase|uniref:threonine aldolase family protein n=1 Tax=Sphingobium TaxID=165695 RepID=UPI000C45FF99|nr:MULTISPECIES: beta-eliminating lyase-related protein [Sphingobium]MAP45107.1 low specificity L-threonine aldolase [Sphingobium sp.]MEC9018033.1 beta-eliminating lyase-related protein [Pseudomonadota bacterium]MBS50312.1 low specificity L-threonine aldolase [Sphingobium sp.]MCC4256555.1 low specificity L-threonine aldolase [Sphingobium lactosutens]HCW61533.1 low specificity L-threonine aldolase [Sphingobium sp.]|tara:strand:- start:62 stop:1072 length:1011 start_codon:yes stop_codon:yes gene_type:complete